MKSSLDPAAQLAKVRPPRRGLRGAVNRAAFAVVVLVVIAIFTAICLGAALAAALLSMG
jgi:hypothetical protein